MTGLIVCLIMLLFVGVVTAQDDQSSDSSSQVDPVTDSSGPDDLTEGSSTQGDVPPTTEELQQRILDDQKAIDEAQKKVDANPLSAETTSKPDDTGGSDGDSNSNQTSEDVTPLSVEELHQRIADDDKAIADAKERQAKHQAAVAGLLDGESLSNYSDERTNTSGTRSVAADLAASDELKPAIFPMSFESKMHGYYELRDTVYKKFGLQYTVDYSAITQYATFSTTQQNATSDVFRILGTWLDDGNHEDTSGHLVWKFEGRNGYTDVVPRNLGFDANSALSTSNYKDLDFGPTNLYWVQNLNDGRTTIIAGHMDPGDWTDQYPLMNPWKYYLSDAFNFPTEQVPKQGFGFAYQTLITDSTYFEAGVTDANGEGSRINVKSFFDTRELFSWVEYGYRPDRSYTSDTNVHLHFWHQDATEQQGYDESWGLNFNYSNSVGHLTTFIRAGYAEGNAPYLRRFVGVGAMFKVKGRDELGIATSWGSPPDKSLRSQITSEVFYRIQVTQNLTISPDMQLTIKPSYGGNEEDLLAIFSLRMRLTF